MKQLTTTPVFNAAAKTLDFTSVSNFTPSRLFGAIDATAGQILFNPAAADYGGSWSGNVLTLQCSTTGLSSSDAVLAFFDDGQNPALESGGNLAAASASLSTAVTRLSSILTVLGSPFQVGGTIGNASFGATQSGAWNVGVSGSLPAFAATPTFNLGALNGAATAASQTNVQSAPGAAQTTAITIQGNASGIAVPVAANLLVGGSAAGPANPVPIYDAYQSAQSTSWSSATGVNAALTLNTAGYDTVIFTLAAPAGLTAGAIAFEAYDGTNWIAIKAPRTDSYLTDTIFTLSGSPGTKSWQLPVAGYPQTRARLATAVIGSGSVGLVGIVSSAPDVSLVTVGIDPNSTLPPFASTPAVAPANQAVGSSNIATVQASVGTSAAQIVAARTGGVGTGRIAVTIYNNGSATVYLGGAGVTTSSGIPLVPGASVSINATAAIYGIASVAAQNVGVLETY